MRSWRSKIRGDYRRAEQDEVQPQPGQAPEAIAAPDDARSSASTKSQPVDGAKRRPMSDGLGHRTTGGELLVGGIIFDGFALPERRWGYGFHVRRRAEREGALRIQTDPEDKCKSSVEPIDLFACMHVAFPQYIRHR